jgi:large subunit ribosomal protein L23
MRPFEDVILKPYITEKSNLELAAGKYTFIVAKNANKYEIKLAVEKLFKVKVLSVNTMIIEGKIKRMGVHEGPRPDWKKAIVKIDLNPKAATYLDKGGKEVASNKKFKSSIEEFGVAQ